MAVSLEEQTEFIFDNGYQRIKYLFPPFFGSLSQVTEQLDRHGLKRPTASQVASLMEKRYFEIKGKKIDFYHEYLFDNMVWEFTGQLYVPTREDCSSGGVFFEDNPLIENGHIHMERQSLIKRLAGASDFAGNGILCSIDKKVRFVPFDFHGGICVRRGRLDDIPHLIGKYGANASGKIVSVASYNDARGGNPRFHIDGFDFVRYEMADYSSIGSLSDWHDNHELHIGGCVGVSKGFAFGIIEE